MCQRMNGSAHGIPCRIRISAVRLLRVKARDDENNDVVWKPQRVAQTADRGKR